MQEVFSEYTTDKRGIPVSVCKKHYHDLFRHLSDRQSCWTKEEKARLNKHFKDAHTLRKSSMTLCTPLTKNIQKHQESPEHPIANIVLNTAKRASSSARAKKTDEKDVLERLRTPPKKKRRGSSMSCRRSDRLKKEHLVQAGIDSGLSGRQLEKHADSLRGQGARGEHAVQVPSGSATRKERSELGKVFLPDFETLETKLCPDNGSAQMCKDVVEFFQKVVYMRGYSNEEVAVIKSNLDGGRGSQKLMAQIIFSDDPILRNDVTEDERNAYDDRHGGYKNTGVKKTLVIGLMSGATESFEVTKFFFDNLIDIKASSVRR